MPWYLEVTADQWRAFFACFMGWVLDGFDFTILTFILVDLEHSFTVSKALAGALGTVTLLFRVAGGIGAGTAADKWGRKLPLMFSILWYSLFAFLSGFSTSYAMLFGLRALFGIGMGGVWAAAMPLTIEHWPPHLRGIASGLLQGGWSWGFMLSTLVYTFIYPLVNTRPDFAWRVMFWIGVLPALMIFWIVKQVKESPVWLARQSHLQERRQTDQVSLVRIFRRDLIGVTLQTSILMGAFIFSYHSLTFWYPTFLRTSHVAPLRFLVAFNAGSIAGAFIWGHVSESRLGRRGAAMLAMLGGVATIPLYILTANTTLLLIGALLMGLTASGAWGVVPSVPHRAVPDVGPGRRGRLRLSRRRRSRLVHPGPHRGAPGPRHGPAACDDAVHHHLLPARRLHDVDRARDPRAGVRRRGRGGRRRRPRPLRRATGGRHRRRTMACAPADTGGCWNWLIADARFEPGPPEEAPQQPSLHPLRAAPRPGAAAWAGISTYNSYQASTTQAEMTISTPDSFMLSGRITESAPTTDVGLPDVEIGPGPATGRWRRPRRTPKGTTTCRG